MATRRALVARQSASLPVACDCAEQQHANGNCCSSPQPSRLYQFVVVLWRVNSAETIFSVADDFAGHCAAIEAGQIFFPLPGVLGRVRANNIALPSAL
jgi:hypothetical protein